MFEILPIKAFSDNYIWAITDHKQVIVVDPGDATPVIDFINERNLKLTGILITHYHPDHIGGINKLLDGYPDIPVWTPASENVHRSTQSLVEGDTVTLPIENITLSVLDVPGHTNGHIAFTGALPSGQPFLLSGDTLFSAGCGRLFEGTPQQMLNSLKKFRALSDNTLVFCTHEYTLSNLAFAMAVEPENTEIQLRIIEVTALRDRNTPSIPCLLGNEKRTNPFLRWDEPSLKFTVEDWADKSLDDDTAMFTAIRSWKDKF